MTALVSRVGNPLFITFEGPEGGGKSTNVSWLAARLQEQGCGVLTARDPGSTGLGEGVRQLALHGQEAPAAMASLFLFEAARAQLVAQVIRPALARGEVVICDRFTDSTLAYQGYGEGLSLETIRVLNGLATGGLTPDVTILLDLDPLLGLRRRRAIQEWDQMEGRDLAFHRQVRSGFRTLAETEPDRWLVVDASRPLAEVHAVIEARIVEARAARGGAPVS
jgi:dTMP kinase